MSKDTPKFLLPAKRSKLDPKGECQWVRDRVRDWAGEQCKQNGSHNSMDHGEKGGCACSGDNGNSKVDLIVLIDGSGSMSGPAAMIGSAAQTAIKNAKKNCGTTDLREHYFTVDEPDIGHGSVPTDFKPVFTHTHQEYLKDVVKAPGPFLQDDTVGVPVGEEGADAISDLANFFDWRDGACRAILYVSDTAPEGDKWPKGSAKAGQDVGQGTQQMAINRAIGICQANNVTVLVHYFPGEGERNDPAWVALQRQNYSHLTFQTGGHARFDPKPSVKLYEELLEDSICNACGICEPFEWPDLKPCVSIKWGASDCDCMESHDDEKLCITICNCYRDVTFRNVSIGYIIVLDENGDWPEKLPDGTPSSRIYPVGPICFGDIGPCNDEGGASCVTQEAVIINRGVKPGKHKIVIGDVCFYIAHHYRSEQQEFEFEICQD